MEEILHHLGCIKPCKQWDIYHINWFRISSINSSKSTFTQLHFSVRYFVVGDSFSWFIDVVMMLVPYKFEVEQG